MTDGPPQQFHDRRRDGVAPDGGAVVHEVGTSISWMCRNTRTTPAIRFAATIQLDGKHKHRELLLPIDGAGFVSAFIVQIIAVNLAQAIRNAGELPNASNRRRVGEGRRW